MLQALVIAFKKRVLPFVLLLFVQAVLNLSVNLN